MAGGGITTFFPGILQFSSLGSSGTPCLTVGSTGLVATSTCGNAGGQAPVTVSFTSTSSIAITHNFNTTQPLGVVCEDNSTPPLQLGSAGTNTSVTSIAYTSANVVTVTFSGPTTGSCTVSTLSVGPTGATGPAGTNGAAGATGPISFVTNPQTSTYQALASDFASGKTIPVATGTFTLTLVASSSQPANGRSILVLNYGSGVVTVARNGQNINGGTASLVIPAGSASTPTGLLVISDGTNYEAQTLGSGGGGTSLTDACGSGYGDWIPWGTNYNGSISVVSNTIYGWELPANSPLCTINTISHVMTAGGHFVWSIWDKTGTILYATTAVASQNSSFQLMTFSPAFQMQANTTYLLTFTTDANGSLDTVDGSSQLNLGTVPRMFTAGNSANWFGALPHLPSTLGTPAAANLGHPSVVFFHD